MPIKDPKTHTVVTTHGIFRNILNLPVDMAQARGLLSRGGDLLGGLVSPIIGVFRVMSTMRRAVAAEKDSQDWIMASLTNDPGTPGADDQRARIDKLRDELIAISNDFTNVEDAIEALRQKTFNQQQQIMAELQAAGIDIQGLIDPESKLDEKKRAAIKRALEQLNSLQTESSNLMTVGHKAIREINKRLQKTRLDTIHAFDALNHALEKRLEGKSPERAPEAFPPEPGENEQITPG